MMPFRLRRVALPLAVLLLGLSPAWAQDALLSGPALAAALRQGGHVLFFRHAATDWGAQDVDRRNLGDCATQRNLSDSGRADARRIGEAVRALGIPIGTVRSSPYCRTQETARLAFGRVDVTPELLSARSAASDAEKERHYQWVRARLSEAPPAGQNTVLVSHGFVAQAALDLMLAEGEAAVVRPGGPTGFRLVGRIRPDDWAALVASGGK